MADNLVKCGISSNATIRHITRAPYPSPISCPNPSPGCKFEMFVRKTWVRVIGMTPMLNQSHACIVCKLLDLLGDLLKEKPVEETGYDNIIVVDNAPKVGPDRMAKLQSVLTKVFGRFGKIVSQDYPIEEDGLCKG